MPTEKLPPTYVAQACPSTQRPAQGHSELLDLWRGAVPGSRITRVNSTRPTPPMPPRVSPCPHVNGRA